MKTIPQKGKDNTGFKITGDWDTQSELLQEKFPQLTNDDLKFVAGKEDDLVDKVATRINKKREEVINIIKKGQPTA